MHIRYDVINFHIILMERNLSLSAVKWWRKMVLGIIVGAYDASLFLLTQMTSSLNILDIKWFLMFQRWISLHLFLAHVVFSLAYLIKAATLQQISFTIHRFISV